MRKNCLSKHVAVSLAALTLVACGGGGGSSIQAPAQPVVTYSLTGSSVAPVPEGIVLEDGKGSTVTLSAGDTSFKFSEGKTYLAAGSSYNVKVKAQPKGYDCTVDRGAAVINSNVSDVVLKCNGPLTKATFSTYIGNRDSSWGYDSFSIDSDGSEMVVIAEELMRIDPAGIMHRAVFLDHATGASIDGLRVRKVTVAPSGFIYVSVLKTADQSQVLRLTRTATENVYVADTLAETGDVGGIVVDGSENVYVADRTNMAVRKISNTGVVTTLAGSGVKGKSDGTGVAASFDFSSFIQSMALDSNGNLYASGDLISVSGLRKITPAGVVTTISVPDTMMNMTADAQGNLYFVSKTSSGVPGIVRISPANVTDIMVSRGAVNFDGTYKFNAIGYIGEIHARDGYIYAAGTNPIAVYKIKVQ
jgi:hypothetical protein